MIDGVRLRVRLEPDGGLRLRVSATQKCRRMHIDCTGMAEKASRADGAIGRTDGPKIAECD